MSNALKKAILTTAMTSSLLMSAGGGYFYGLGGERHRPTTEEERKFVDKQGYKAPSEHDRASQYRRRLKRKVKNYKGHKHGGARR